MRLLFLSPYIPSRIRVRPYHWIRSLARLGHEVHLVALTGRGDGPAPLDDLRGACTAVDLFRLARSRTVLNAAIALAERGTPLQLAYSRHPGAARVVAGLAASGRYDIVHVEHMRGVALASQVRSVPVVYDAVDSISALFEETARRAPTRLARLMGRLDLARSRRFEARAPFAFARTVVTSEREAAAFVSLAGQAARERVSVVGNGVDTDYFRPAERPVGRAVVFTGKLSYHANAAAAARLAERIMPRVWERRPGTPVILAGQAPPARLRALARDRRITVTGYVEDLRRVFAEAAVAVCPLVYGAGIQNKVLESMASGVATVMASAASRALGGTVGRDYLACDDDEAFADAIVGLLDDETRRLQLAAAGREYVLANHRWERLAASLVRVYEDARAEFAAVAARCGPALVSPQVNAR